MHILPIRNVSALQINPFLSVILTNDMEGWFMERYVNIFMNGAILGYVDDVNYAGVVHSERCYVYDEVQSSGIVDIIEQELDKDHFLILWVDEIAIPFSIRYQRYHFIHPMMIYGYDEDQQIVKAIFFDLSKGSILADISYQDIVKATSCLDEFYLCGGTEDAIKATASSYCLSQYTKGIFHLDVFARQLNNYICCQTDHLTEWYTLSRPHVFDSDDNIFGIQIYLQLIKFLSVTESKIELGYKALHDFVLHKKYLLDRFLYIQKNYDTSCKYDELVEKFAQNSKILERARLLNMKNQMKLGRIPASLCCDANYIALLINTLNECYQTEMTIMPQIYEEIIKLTYSKEHSVRHRIMSMPPSEKSVHDYHNYIEFGTPDSGIYVSRIDIIRKGKYFDGDGFEYILVNDDVKYFLEKDSPDHMPIRTVKTPVFLLKTLKLYTDRKECDYTVNVYALSDSAFSDHVTLKMDDRWSGYHHVKRLDNIPTGEMILSITDEDPFVVREQIGVYADACPYIHVRMSTTAPTIYAQIYFSTVSNPNLSMDKSLFFKIIPDGQYHSYYINMSQHNQWRGLIQTIRFDPAQFHDDYPWNKDEASECKLACMEFLKRKPDDVDECMTDYMIEEDGSNFR